MTLQQMFAHKHRSDRESAKVAERVKIYGERKTGTTFLTDLMRKNFSVPLLSGTPDRPNRAERERLMERVADRSSAVRRIVLDRIGDQENRRALPDTLGWKHMYPPIALLQTMPNFVAGTLFLVTVKHPVYWRVSYHRRPLDYIINCAKVDFSEFLRGPFVPTLRDGVDTPLYTSAIEFYAEKVDGYRRLCELAPRFELVRYENLLTDVPGFVEQLVSKHGLPRHSERPVIRETSTNHRESTFDEYRQEYRLDRVREAVSPDDYDFIMQNFGGERLTWLGYSA
jgi:hypothetical protein